ncbi:hypothetical protein [Aureitalea marina]|nr:hypothetical protein [Aureitalea marina]
MKRKITLLVGLLLSLSMGLAQDDNPIDANNAIVIQNLSAIGAGGQNLGGTSMVISPARNISGSVHLFESWTNTGVLEVTTGESTRFLIRNINFNLYRKVFESKVSEDTIFTFDNKSLERAYINGREFKEYYFPVERGSTYFEVIYENSDFSLLKYHYLTFTEGSDNPMVNRPSKYEQQSTYYLRKKNSFKVFRMRKKDVVTLVGDKEGQLMEFVDKYDLSFKRELDVKRMLDAVLGTE